MFCSAAYFAPDWHTGNSKNIEKFRETAALHQMSIRSRI
jgi:hypothetical protein